MQQKETLSAYMDGQVNGTEFADTLTNSPELKAKWASYHMIRNARRRGVTQCRLLYQNRSLA
jgi:negative regulator of sigma E activity